ncbi:MAG TPA: 50S ribosomal protein L16 [Ktedonobacteraceae bacterium]|nr:50S ribosomal protein L16 [Ktedonobacteraceae bacterium]
MLLAPSRTRYRRQHRGRMRGQATRGNTLAFGEFGLQALEPCWLEARQIESARIALTRFMKRGGKVWIRVFPDKPISAKPAETRMGSGKGAVDHWVAVVKPGRVIFEIGGVHHDIAKEAVRLASHKLPIKTRFIVRGEAESVQA